MKVEVYTTDGVRVPPEQVEQVETADKFVPDLVVHTAFGAFGEMVSDTIEAGDYSVYNHVYRIVGSCSLHVQFPVPLLQAVLVMQGSLLLGAKDLKAMALEQGQFAMLYAPDATAHAIFPQEAGAQAITLHFPPALLEIFTESFRVQPLLEATDHEASAWLFDTPGWLTAEILQEIAYMLEILEQAPVMPMLLEIQMQSLLCLLMAQHYDRSNGQVDAETTATIRRIQHFIEGHMGVLLTVDQVSTHMGIDAKSLTRLFPLVTGMHIDEFIRRARLNNGKLLVHQTNMPIGHIATAVGYAHAEDFIKAFKRMFSMTPLTIRKRAPF